MDGEVNRRNARHTQKMASSPGGTGLHCRLRSGGAVEAVLREQKRNPDGPDPVRAKEAVDCIAGFVVEDFFDERSLPSEKDVAKEHNNVRILIPDLQTDIGKSTDSVGRHHRCRFGRKTETGHGGCELLQFPLRLELSLFDGFVGLEVVRTDDGGTHPDDIFEIETGEVQSTLDKVPAGAVAMLEQHD